MSQPFVSVMLSQPAEAPYYPTVTITASGPTLKVSFATDGTLHSYLQACD